jgi:hypothetical protein
LEISVRAALIPIGEKLHRFPSGNHGLALPAGYGFEDPECGQIVLDLLECSQRAGSR